ncbi:AprI/Inh family metalloprotease inhibitor [Lichenihabitans psoromatis]|uniref:AprI/Inh family metalloprotease inhibitor n=1 Tax=Lichenihabitans psoromatis TaxID=2528642 RepID=UPI001035BB6B|nr:AprI/Inh family metalloprotease inhibitor [Lichenihabitans psoromatis]
MINPAFRPMTLLAAIKAFSIAVAVLCAGTPVQAAAPEDGMAMQDAGTWDMSFEKGNRRCRVNLTATAVTTGYAITMPAGCHRAFPTLATVRAWVPQPGDHVVLLSDAGQPVLDFGPAGGPSLSAVASEQDVYKLTPTDQARQAALSIVTPDSTAPADLPPDPSMVVAAPPTSSSRAVDPASIAPVPSKHLAAPVRAVSIGEVAGGYAVVRQGKDTGCMVTLDDKMKGAKTGLRAKLAPACRDQGIVIFDPVGWQIIKGQLVLTAKKGHTAELSLQEDGTWANAPAKGRPLVLKRL